MKRIVLACLVVTASLGVAVGLTHFRDLGVAHAQGSDEVVDISGRRSVELPHPMLVYTPGPNLYDEQHAGRESIPRLDYVADGSGSGAVVLPPPPVVDAPAPAAGSGSQALPSDQLHDPLSTPAAAFDDLKAAKKIGWVVAVLAGLILMTRLLSRLGGVFTFLGRGKVAVIVAGISATAIASYNALLLEGSWVAAVAAGLLTLATVFDAAVRPKQ